MKRVVLSFCIFIQACGSLLAESTGASFLTINPSARLASLGGAGSAGVSNASSLYLNPAGMAASEFSELSLMHTQLFEGNNLSSLAFSQPFGRNRAGQAFGLTATYMSYGEIEGRAEDRSLTSSIRASDLSVGVGYARLMGRFTSGVTVKGIQQRIGSVTATGVALDFGVQRPIPVDGMSIGVAVNNLGPSMKFISEEYRLPTAVRLGLDYEINQFSFLADIGKPVHDGKLWYALGTEFTPVSMLSMRLGYLMTGESQLSSKARESELSRFAGMSGGIGLRFNRYTFDYSMTPHSQLGNTQKIGFSAAFQ